MDRTRIQPTKTHKVKFGLEIHEEEIRTWSLMDFCSPAL